MMELVCVCVCMCARFRVSQCSPDYTVNLNLLEHELFLHCWLFHPEEVVTDLLMHSISTELESPTI